MEEKYLCLQVLTQSGILDISKYFMNPFIEVSLSAVTLICCSSLNGGVSLTNIIELN